MHCPRYGKSVCDARIRFDLFATIEMCICGSGVVGLLESGLFFVYRYPDMREALRMREDRRRRGRRRGAKGLSKEEEKEKRVSCPSLVSHSPGDGLLFSAGCFACVSHIPSFFL